MDNGIYIALSRQVALFRDMAVTTNNIANANTTGFQAEKVIFSQYLKKDNNQGSINNMAFANDVASYRYTKDGSQRATGNDLDVSISGAGYFAVQTPLGTRYTRAGNFQLNAEGTLVTPEGYAVLDNSNQPITFPPDAQEIQIGKAGNINVNGQDFGSIGVALFANPQLLVQTSSGLYKSEIEPQFGDTENIHVTQGMLENANVEPVIELTHMIEVSRAVSSTAKYIEIMYDLQRKTASAWTQQA